MGIVCDEGAVTPIEPTSNDTETRTTSYEIVHVLGMGSGPTYSIESDEPQQYIFARFVHPWNAYPAISVTDEGIMIEVRPVHPSKVISPIYVTDEGMIIEIRLVQL